MVRVYQKFLISFLSIPFLESSCLLNFNWTNVKPEICVGDINYSFGAGKPVDVFYKIIIMDIFDVSEEKMEFGLHLLVLEFWKDPLFRITFNTLEAVPIPNELAQCLWQPDLIFPNCKDSFLYKVTVDNMVLKLIPEEYILRYSRFSLKVNCPMEFQSYPLDTQTCSLNITLFSSFKNRVILHWVSNRTDSIVLGAMGDPVTFLNNVKPHQFDLKNVVPRDDTIALLNGDIEISMLVCEFHFQRHITASLVNTYIPSFLVVCLSMVSFWLDVNAVPGRVTLGVTALLTLSTMIVHARSSLPSVNYMTAMDVWLFGCLIFVFFSLIEFTTAQSLTRSIWAAKKQHREQPSRWRVKAWSSVNPEKTPRPDKMYEKQPTTVTRIRNDASLSVLNEHISSMIDTRLKNVAPQIDTISKFKTAAPVERVLDNILDRISRIFFPVCLFSFITVYWIHFVK